jgi:Arc/MetJ-type ribon-helix-helix transcriptional regulator
MNMALTPGVQHRIEAKLKQGRWNSASAVVETALDLLDDLDEIIVLSREELDARIDESLTEIERGEVYTEAEARAYLAKARAAR